MNFFEPHIHMASRTTDDLKAMSEAGCLGLGEPAFWMGFDRGSVESFRDYFRQLTEWEPKRAAQFGMSHYCWLGINAKEAENVPFAREVIALVEEFLDHPNVLGVGEIGLNKNTANEVTTLRALIALALKHDQQMLFHTPHLEHKYQGTRMILDLLNDEPRIDRSRVIIDHCEEHTIRMVLEAGYWAGITLYPTTKASPERAVDMIERYGAHRVLVTSSADWGPSDPLAVPRLMAVLRARGHDSATIRQLVYDNPLAMMRQSRHFREGTK